MKKKKIKRWCTNCTLLIAIGLGDGVVEIIVQKLRIPTIPNDLAVLQSFRVQGFPIHAPIGKRSSGARQQNVFHFTRSPKFLDWNGMRSKTKKRQAKLGTVALLACAISVCDKIVHVF